MKTMDVNSDADVALAEVKIEAGKRAIALMPDGWAETKREFELAIDELEDKIIRFIEKIPA
jgi:hypothetical protein